MTKLEEGKVIEAVDDGTPKAGPGPTAVAGGIREHDVPLVFRSIQAPYSVRDMSDRYSVYSTINTRDVNAMLSKGLDRFYEKYRHLTKGENVHLPTPEIRFENVEFSAECPVVPSSEAWTVGGQFTKLFLPFRKQMKVKRQILHPMSGVVKPGSMTLVLGGPSSGKSSFLKALAGKLRGGGNRIVKGRVLYSGLTADQIQLNKVVGIVDQTDNHCATLTVRETFQFADTSLNGLPQHQPETLQGIAALRTELMIHLLGLESCSDTVVGDALLRGVSGGERKRVTIGEMLVGGQSLFLCDEISTGLDSATTYDIMNAIRTWTKSLGGSAIVALLQPPPEVVELFDDIVLMGDGRIVYHGSRESILPHFQSLGFSCPIKTDPADFLVEVASGHGYQFRNGEVSEKDLPLNSADFERCFHESELGKVLDAELSKGYNLPTNYETAEQFRQFKSVANLARSKSNNFGLSFYDSLACLVKRQGKVFVRDKPLIYGKLTEAVVVGLLLGTVYFHADASLYLRMIFFAIALFMRQSWQQLTISFGLRQVFYKQRSRDFFRTSTYSVADAIVQIPINLTVSCLMATIFYFMSGLHRDAGTFFIFLLTTIAFQHAIAAYMSFLSALAPNVTIAQIFAGCSVCFFLLFGGNIIYYNLIPGYWIWMYWFDPISWALRTNMLNEFHSHFPKDVATTKLAAFSLNKFGLEWRWIGILVLWYYYIIFTFFQALALHFIRYEKKVTVNPEDVDSEEVKSTKKKLCADGHEELPNQDLNISTNEITMKIANAGQHETSVDAGFVPAYLCIRDLKYWVPNPAGKYELQLLQGITAYFEPGKMTALMGATGAGKTTLMDVVAGRKTGGRIEGEVLVNGIPKNPRTFSRIAGYCEQMDIHSFGATVYEALMFSASLRLPAETSNQTRIDLVNDTIQLLDIEHIRNRMVGRDPTEGLSVEQRKRLTIAVELVANPSIIFLDEPTSGLDARSAQTVMRGVQKIARSGRTVVCTIHQPSVQIFELFDRLLLLKSGGYTAYFGSLGKDSCDMLSYFLSIPGTAKIEPLYNPATYMLEVIGAGVGRTTADGLDYAEVYAESELRKVNDQQTIKYCQPTHEKFQKFPVYKPIATSFMNQFKELAVKTQRTYWRTPQYTFTRLAAYPLFAVIFGTTFYQMKNETDKNINSQVGLIYNCMDFIGIINLMTVLETTCAERAVFYRERMSNYYDVLPYSLSLFVAELPYLVVVSMLFVAVEYFLIGLDSTAIVFFRFYAAFWLFTSLCTFIGQWMSVLTPDVKVANVAVGAISCVVNLLSGYLVPYKFMRRGYKWISYILPSRYAFTALVSQQLSRCSDVMGPNGLVIQNGTEPGCKLIKVTGLDGKMTLQRTVDFVHNVYGVSTHDEYVNYVVLIAMWVFVNTAIFLTLKYVSHLVR